MTIKKPEQAYSSYVALNRLQDWLDANGIRNGYEVTSWMQRVMVPIGEMDEYGKEKKISFYQNETLGGGDGPLRVMIPGEDSEETTLEEAKSIIRQFLRIMDFSPKYAKQKYEKALSANTEKIGEINRLVRALAYDCSKVMRPYSGTLTKPFELAGNGEYSILYDSVSNNLLSKSSRGIDILGPNSPVECLELFNLAKKNLSRGNMEYVRGMKEGNSPDYKTIEEETDMLEARLNAMKTGKTPEMHHRKATGNPQPNLFELSSANGRNPDRTKAPDKSKNRNTH